MQKNPLAKLNNLHDESSEEMGYEHDSSGRVPA
jgi:hypothetical protein